MQHRIKRDPALFNLISEYENMSRKGHLNYFEDKDLFQLINYYEDEHALDKALEVVDLALDQYTYRSDFYTIKARLLLTLGDIEEAMELLENAENISPYELEVKLLKARAFSELGCFSEALELVQQARQLSQSSELIDILFCEAFIYEDAKQFSDMYNSLKEILYLDPENDDALERLWVSVELSKSYKDSVKFHSWLIGKNPYSYLAWYNLGHAYACIGKYEEAINALEYSFLINDRFEIGYKDCAELCFQVCDFKMALAVYKEALTKFGNDSELLSSVGQCYIKLDQHATAKSYLERASKIDPYNDEVFYFLGECYSRERKWAHAIRHYIKAIQLEDRREEYYAGLANTYERLEDFTKADYYYSKATETGPEDPGYWFMHARFLLSIEEPEAASQVLEEAEYHTYGYELLYCKAAVFLALGKKDVALEWLRQALNEEFEKYTLIFDLYPQAEIDKDILMMLDYFEKEHN
jgi:tetratricopeptide (TPR) repeat protein